MLTILSLIALQAFAPVEVNELAVVRHLPKTAAAAIVEGVNADEEEPLLGSKKGEAVLIAVYMQHESSFKKDAVGDHGLSLGPLQLQRMEPKRAFDYKVSVVEWLKRAHTAYALCTSKGVTEEERLSAVVSGNCEHGHMVARLRWRTAVGLLKLDELRDEAKDEAKDEARRTWGGGVDDTTRSL